MRELLLDTSVLLKWFHRDGEDEIEHAEWHLQAHRAGLLHAHVLDLGMYELGNVLVRALNEGAPSPGCAGDDQLCAVPIDVVRRGLRTNRGPRNP